MSKYRIGYLDDERGHQNSFYAAFNEEFDVEIIEFDKISSPADVFIAVEEKSIELLILDYILNTNGKSFNADKIVSEMKGWNRHFPVLIITSYPNDAFKGLENVNIVNYKGDINRGSDNYKLLIVKFEENIKKYKKRLESAYKRINELNNKKLRESLSIKEEEEYYETYNFLKDIEPSEKTFPPSILTPQTISTLNDLLNSTKELINHLKGEK